MAKNLKLQRTKPKIFKTEKAWLEARSKVITATEVSSLFSLNPYASVQKMWQRKIVPEFQENAYTLVGKVLEPAVVKAVNLTLDTDFKDFVNHNNEISFFIREDMKLGATPDAVFRDTLLECKTTTPRNFEKWDEHPPFYYILQVHVQMMCAGYSHAILACLSNGLTPASFNAKLPLKIFRVERLAGLDELLESEVRRFWESVNFDNMELNFSVNRSIARRMKEWLLQSTTRILI